MSCDKDEAMKTVESSWLDRKKVLSLPPFVPKIQPVEDPFMPKWANVMKAEYGMDLFFSHLLAFFLSTTFFPFSAPWYRFAYSNGTVV